MKTYEKTNRADKVKEIMKQLEDGVQSVFTSQNYADYLKMMTKFHRYSFRNSILIWMQCPHATHVAGYNDWQKNFNRHVKKGEKGISILAPMMYTKKSKDTENSDADADTETTTEKTMYGCKAVYVFDVSQTEGEELPSIVKELNGKIDNYSQVFNTLEKISPVPIAFEDIKNSSYGYYDRAENRIAIKSGLSESQTIKTMIHEITHAKLHALPEDDENKDNKFDRETAEVQAESVAYVVCNNYGLDTSDYSFGYVAGWSSGKKMPELTKSMDVIRKTSQEIIEAIDSAIQVKE